ncbi:hypothetical protein, partial [Burkholderia gladioli]|uniref:hypothetical protein n=1 Tax=Burkholderia gladioli TaxID=28095 RepID=UPI0034DB7B28
GSVPTSTPIGARKQSCGSKTSWDTGQEEGNGATFAILRSVSQGCREACRRPYYRVFPRGCDLMYRS